MLVLSNFSRPSCPMLGHSSPPHPPRNIALGTPWSSHPCSLLVHVGVLPHSSNLTPTTPGPGHFSGCLLVVTPSAVVNNSPAQRYPTYSLNRLWVTVTVDY